MYRFTRHALGALTAVSLLAGMATGCSGSSGARATSQARETASPTATPTTQPTSPSGRERLDEEAHARLGSVEQLDPDDAAFVESGTLAIPGENLDEAVGPGTVLRVDVACAGRGTVTFTAVSGSAKKAVRVDCTRPVASGFDFTTAAQGLAVQADASEAARVGTAYLVRHAS
ncbi:hypothetical protein [Streptomyces sp. NPDC016845]|uniref:hypothetical protein n=1 Tax=Streptomyces sp. NPDC016845 TaxID=3364972 RepID=UPI0037B4C405